MENEANKNLKCSDYHRIFLLNIFVAFLMKKLEFVYGTHS